MIYLDNAASTPVRREALEAMWSVLTSRTANPSSRHEPGQAAAAVLADARATVARVLGCRPAEVVFTSGGTEAANLAVKGIALADPRGRHIITTPIEHEAVLESCAYLQRSHGFDVTSLGVDETGLVDPDALRDALRPDTTLVSIQYANNEVGTVQPLAELSAIARAERVPFHTDAVQAAGWLPLHIGELGVDALGISGHKVGAPPGTGALAVRGRVRVEPLLHGGGQERGRRSGTENAAGALALATALGLAEEARGASASRTARIRDRFVAQVLQACPGARITGHPESRLPGTASFVVPGVSGEALLLELERRDVVCSSGSACAAGRDEPSHVLVALGVSADVAFSAVRFTFGTGTTDADAVAAAAAFAASVASLRRLY